MRWEVGRQGTGYSKLKLWSSSILGCDCYLIKYPIGSYIPTHTDPVPGKKHYRLNLLLIGEDNFQGESLFSSKRIKLFRPDIVPHSVEQVLKTRLVFSIGWVR